MTLLYKSKTILYPFVCLIGLISSFSLPPYNIFYVNFFSFPALFWILLFYSKEKFTSFNIGWIFGFGYFVSNLYWITNSLTFEEIFEPLIPFALILIPLFLGLFYAFATLTFSFLNPKRNLLSILILSTSFSIFEYIRSFIFGGFPWNLIAFSFVNYLEFIQILSITGTYAFNSIIIFIFLLPAVLFFDYTKNLKIRIFIISILFVLTNYLWGNSNLKNYELAKKKRFGVHN